MYSFLLTSYIIFINLEYKVLTGMIDERVYRSVKAIERILHESMTFAPFGLPADTIYVLNNGKLEISDQGEFSIDSYNDEEDEEWDPLEHGSWAWNEQTVTEGEYNEKLKEATRAMEGFPVSEIEWKDKDVILKELSGNIANPKIMKN